MSRRVSALLAAAQASPATKSAAGTVTDLYQQRAADFRLGFGVRRGDGQSLVPGGGRYHAILGNTGWRTSSAPQLRPATHRAGAKVEATGPSGARGCRSEVLHAAREGRPRDRSCSR
jgi:hypothetical protein